MVSRGSIKTLEQRKHNFSCDTNALESQVKKKTAEDANGSNRMVLSRGSPASATSRSLKMEDIIGPDTASTCVIEIGYPLLLTRRSREDPLVIFLKGAIEYYETAKGLITMSVDRCLRCAS